MSSIITTIRKGGKIYSSNFSFYLILPCYRRNKKKPKQTDKNKNAKWKKNPKKQQQNYSTYELGSMIFKKKSTRISDMGWDLNWIPYS